MSRGFATAIDLQTLSFETKITLSKQVAECTSLSHQSKAVNCEVLMVLRCNSFINNVDLILNPVCIRELRRPKPSRRLLCILLREDCEELTRNRLECYEKTRFRSLVGIFGELKRS